MIITDCTFEELQENPFFSEEKPFRIKQIAQWVYTKSEFDFDNMTNLSKQFREKLKGNVEILSIEKAGANTSKDGTTKYVFKLRDGLFIESVLIPMNEGKVTFCISSQVGCAMGCKFCKTATMGFIRNLTPSEIVSQVLLLKKYANLPEKKKFNIVFMGMGEPLHNTENVFKAIQILTDKNLMDLSPRRITISTSGLIEGIKKLANFPIKVRLAISLNASKEKQREEIMPVTKGNPLSKLIDTLRKFPLSNRDRITFEYVLLKDFNDKKEDALRVYKLLKGIKYKINLIPFNPYPGSKFDKPEEKKVLEFQKILTDRGINAIIRKSKGEDISAACGMLASKTKKD
ncbi:23S rRNA (adenine2503-C2)-methyltransferase [Thermotomaculum hydrothermale]|uniref:Probable dual-specificity RNA methyltransferase RlmN n=1 Tax=Thermotomaculum hydrothermale TaxID=981385 RepID=A0A7R6PQU3_9BACT|nr:23S rRNA (adenine(2503)-C(2))-methyltransferase RlmN [Thermotomaculum hydrothermale]BBB33651.1 23S rRNA (adenine2503-C2)-methyltransferase [Thermotomaculum hydrothermale]